MDAGRPGATLRPMTEPAPTARTRYGEAIAAEVGALEGDIRHRVVDLEEAFTTRDWAMVARIYREVAEIADRLEALDPNARSVSLTRAEEAMEVARSLRPAALDDEAWSEEGWA
jgi:hypothetical protein